MSGESKVVAVSGKSRAAILLGGHMGKAYWFNEGAFVTNPKIYGPIPNWLQSVNATFKDIVPDQWTTSQPEYSYRRRDNRSSGSMGNLFPHRLDGADDVRHSPYLDTLTLAVARAAIKGESLGRREWTDIPFVSWSATDRTGRFFGPQSREMEDNLLRLDDELTEFVAWLDQELGLSNVVLALTADYGAELVPEESARFGMPLRRLDMAEILAECADDITAHTNIEAELHTTFLAPHVYLNSNPE